MLFSTRLFFLLAAPSLGEVVEAELTDSNDAEGDESCALQVKRMVNCGGHSASNCQACIEGDGYYHGEAYCNGDCEWVGQNHYQGQCVPKSGQACCMANTLECVSCAAGMTEEQYCQQRPNDQLCQPARPREVCALCFSCGGDFPMTGGRVTYFQNYVTKFSSYGEECSGQNRERTGDNTVIFAPDLCCTSSRGALLEIEAPVKAAMVDVQKHSELSAVQAVKVDSHDAANEDGWCRLCDQCGGGYDFEAGTITELANGGDLSNANSQNYQRYTGQCSQFSSTGGAPPAAKVCCKRTSSYVGMCSVCAGGCGGQYPNDGGALSFTQQGETVKYRGLGWNCGYSLAERFSTDLSDAPRLCCI